MPDKPPTEEQLAHARQHAIHLLNNFEAVATGWVLKLDREKVGDLLEPLYEMVDERR